MEPVIIIGSGLAAYNVARELRKHDKTAPLVILSRDDAGFYSKPMLSNALASGKNAATLVMKSAEKMATELDATVRTRVEVTAIEANQQRIQLSSGETLNYRDLVLAIGADPIRLPMAGNAADEVLSVNDLDSFAYFTSKLAGAKRVVILGAGLIGCEFANDLLALGIEPVVLDPSAWPLGRLLPQATGEYAAARLGAAGVQFRFGIAASAVDRLDSGYRVTLNNGETLETDLVLSAVGLRARTQLAAAAGLKTNRGIVTDRLLRTSDPHIYALGDCAEVAGLTLPFVLPIMQAARALGATLAGTPTEVAYPAMPVVVKTPACPTVVAPPAMGAPGEWLIDADADKVDARFIGPEGQLLGYALLGSATALKQSLGALLPPTLA